MTEGHEDDATATDTPAPDSTEAKSENPGSTKPS
jgi:hypothetical protein